MTMAMSGLKGLNNGLKYFSFFIVLKLAIAPAMPASNEGNAWKSNAATKVLKCKLTSSYQSLLTIFAAGVKYIFLRERKITWFIRQPKNTTM